MFRRNLLLLLLRKPNNSLLLGMSRTILALFAVLTVHDTMGLCRLRCSITDKKLVNLIAGNSVKTLVNDVRDTWKLFAAKLAPLADQGSPYAQPAASAEDVTALLAFYAAKGKEVRSC